jgi:uncharacterized phage protein (TIGR02218 family)
MSYAVADASVHDGAPIECYLFAGQLKEYRYTSAESLITLDGREYEPLPIKRGSVKSGSQADDSLSLEIELPIDCDLVRDYAYLNAPASLMLSVFRVHRETNFATDSVLLWKGEVLSFSVAGRTAKARVPSIFSAALSSDCPTVFYQNPCNHVLFDARCKVSRASFSTSTTVLDAAQTNATVVDDGFPDNFLAGGEMVNSRNGERRMIVDNQVNLITINFAFVDLRVGDSVTLTAGCDHSWTTCRSKFSNGDNYGGDPFIPSENPFQGKVA